MNRLIQTIIQRPSRKQCAEFGQVAVLVCLFFALYLKDPRFVLAGFILIFITVVVPVLFYPLAAVWFAAALVLSAVSTRIILSTVFILLVTPVSVIRKCAGRDPLRLREFRKNKRSVFTTRNHVYVAGDLENTF